MNLRLEAPVIKREHLLPSGLKLGELVLNQPKSLNSLNMAMVLIIEEALETWREDEGLVAVVLRGAGEKSFCAGGDIKSARASAIAHPGGPCVEAEAFFEKEYKVDYAIHTYPKPILALGHGYIMGGGMGLYQGADYRLLEKSSVLAMPEISIGLFTDVGAGYFYNQLSHDIGLYLGLTGAQLQSADALVLGLCDAVFENKTTEDILSELQMLSWTQESDLNQAMLKNYVKQHFKTQHTGESNISRHLDVLTAICQKTNLQEMVEAIHAHTETPFLQKASANLKQGSPISAHLIYRHLIRCKTKTLEEIFEADKKLSTHSMRHPEFSEGVRALLIDKDKSPNWTYKKVEEVPENLIEKMLGEVS